MFYRFAASWVFREMFLVGNPLLNLGVEVFEKLRSGEKYPRWESMFLAVIEFGEGFLQFLPLIATLFVAALVLFVAERIFSSKATQVGEKQKFTKPLVMLGLSAICLIGVILALPLGAGLKGNLLSLLGLVLTGIIGLSSTTFVSNAMAGFMIRSVGSFRSGDFIKVESHFGRVSERGLFHTEIQTEDRDLTTLPNLYLVMNPVSVVRSSGTIVSANISLGYDVRHDEVETYLKRAAEAAGLDEPFVQVLELGDFTVVYRIAGFLKDTKGLVTARSRIRVEAMNTLHEAGIEIMSPSVMMQRPISSEERIMPKGHGYRKMAKKRDAVLVEEKIFDKAERAENLERLQEALKDLGQRRAELEKSIQVADADAMPGLEKDLSILDAEIESVNAALEGEG